MPEKKVQVATIYTAGVGGKAIEVRAENGKKFEYKELQVAVGGYIESLQPDKKQYSQMFCNEEGLINRLPDNKFTWDVVNKGVYKLNGYPPFWRVSGNIVGLRNKPVSEVDLAKLPTISEALQIHGKLTMVETTV